MREANEPARGIRIRVSGDDVADILKVVAGMPPADALYALVMALVQHVGRNEKQDPATGRWLPMSDEEMKAFLAALTSDMRTSLTKAIYGD